MSGDPNDLVPLVDLYDSVEAELVSQALESEGFEVFLQGVGSFNAYAPSTPIRIFVRAEDLEEAKVFLQESQ